LSDDDRQRHDAPQEQQHSEDVTMPRALRKGTLGFGLVTIAVQLHTAEATEERLA
jgi:hypothetical protein